MSTINYAQAQKRWPKQKSALTRAINSGDPAKVKAACRAVVKEWDEDGAWPDDWARWQRALDDILPWNQAVSLEDVAYRGA